MSRFLAAVHRNILGDAENNVSVTIVDQPIPDALDRQLHRAVKKIGEDITGLRFNTAIAELIKLNNEVTGMKEVPREFANSYALLLAPFAPHLAEEIWHQLGHNYSLSRTQWPLYDESKLVETSLELPVQVNGKLRDKITVAADASEADIFAAALASDKVKPWLDGKTEKKRLYVPGRLVNFVVA
jgi:leucyl-tRNA synthetase